MRTYDHYVGRMSAGSGSPTILFVCTGNICRSPMAEYLARAVSDHDGFSFTSAGISAPVGAPASSGAVLAMAEVGIDLSDHRACEVWEIGSGADLVIALSREHLIAMRRAWPERAGSMLMLRPDERSIADPYGLDTAAYRATRDEIAEAVAARAAAGWV